MEGEHERNEIKLYLTTDLQNQFPHFYICAQQDISSRSGDTMMKWNGVQLCVICERGNGVSCDRECNENITIILCTFGAVDFKLTHSSLWAKLKPIL